MSMDTTQQPRRLPMIPGPGKVDKMQSPGTPAIGHNRPPQVYQLGPIGDIAKGIAEVMASVGTIEKKGVNKFHGYAYARMEDVLQVVTPLMGKAGLAVMQNEIEVQNIEGNRIRIIYEFTLFHQNGQTLPPVRQSGTSMARDSKGNFDDKAFAKCHTNARKYYLLGLFGVPAGDFPDPDDDDANQRPASRPVPGPSQAPQKAAAAAPAPETARAPAQAPTEAAAIDLAEGPPKKLEMPQGTSAQAWSEMYIRCIGKAKSVEEIAAWDNMNDDYLQRISDRYSVIYDRIKAAVDSRMASLSPAHAMPDPRANPAEAMSWVAGQLAHFSSYEAGEAFWNEVVAPNEKQFDLPDWERLLGEWARFEQRFPIDDSPATPGLSQ